ncbi:MAG: aldo/keto reductase [Lachnospiraceae bacterium]|nr:aldo/keto reductase [Lachnospiraceae bacterium]
MVDESYYNGTKLGFDLAQLAYNDSEINRKKANEMVDRFLHTGFRYFDTGSIYPASEIMIRKTLVERHPRNRYTLAARLFATLLPTEKSAKMELDASLEKIGVKYFDYYILHSLAKRNYNKNADAHLWNFLSEEKTKGRIRHYGFFHRDSPERLDQILTEHPDADFVQLQINYADWEDIHVRAKDNYLVARKHGKAVVASEPLKGGTLIHPPYKVQNIFDEVDWNASYASWAFRFVASLEGVHIVLSKISSLRQMEELLSYIEKYRPLNAKERHAFQRIQELKK